MLGSCLFLFYINDLPDNLRSNVRIFADDTIASSTNDSLTLQEDLRRLEMWEAKWFMEFHPEKCQVLTISRKHKAVWYEYNLHGIVLEHVTLAKYLGVTIQYDMKWNTNINKITSSPNRSLGFLRKNLQINSHDLKTVAYNALVKPLT